MIAYKKQSSRNKRANNALNPDENPILMSSTEPALAAKAPVIEVGEDDVSSDSSVEHQPIARPPTKKQRAASNAAAKAAAQTLVSVANSLNAARAKNKTADANATSGASSIPIAPHPLVEGQPITVDQKIWLATQVNAGKVSAYELHKENKVAARSVYRYAYKLRKGLMIREKSGRPPALDEESEEAVLNLLRDNPSVERRVLIQFIRDQHLKTWTRRQNALQGGMAAATAAPAAAVSSSSSQPAANGSSSNAPEVVEQKKPNKLSMRSIDRYLIRIMQIRDGKTVGSNDDSEADDSAEPAIGGKHSVGIEDVLTAHI